MMVLMVNMSDRYLAQLLGCDCFSGYCLSGDWGLPIFTHQSFYISDPALTLPPYSSTMYVK